MQVRLLLRGPRGYGQTAKTPDCLSGDRGSIPRAPAILRARLRKITLHFFEVRVNVRTIHIAIEGYEEIVAPVKSRPGKSAAAAMSARPNRG